MPALVSVTKKLKMLIVNFTYETIDERKKFQLDNLVTSPKRYGGLGVKDLLVFNSALLGNSMWRFRNETSFMED